MTDAMMRSPEEEASREEMLREQYNQQFGQQGRGMGNDMNFASNRMSGGMPSGKDGRPLPDPNQAGSVGTDPLSFLRNQTMINNGMAPSFNQRRRGFNRNAEMAPQPMEPMPAYDRPENRNYNMAALYQMMGGY